MRIGVLTHNYPRFAGDFSGVFIEALCAELARQGDEVIVWAPDDPAYTRADFGDVTLRRYPYAWPRRLQQLGYMRSMQSDMTLRLRNYALSPLLFAAGIWRVDSDALPHAPRHSPRTLAAAQRLHGCRRGPLAPYPRGHLGARL